MIANSINSDPHLPAVDYHAPRQAENVDAAAVWHSCRSRGMLSYQNGKTIMRPRRRLTLWFALSLALGGCATQTTQVVTAQPPSIAMPRAESVQATPNRTVTERVAATSGKRQQVEFRTAINPDCTLSGPVSFEFISKPGHGTVEFEEANEFAVWAPSNPRSRCNERRLHGAATFYTSEPNFRGVDLFVLALLTPTGERRVLPVVVDVR